ncbi:MAG: tetratricopeptide repeat protein [Wenzhouxiangella sp.]
MNKALKNVDVVLQATLFGRFHLSLPSGEEIEITGKRAGAVLAILCLTPGVAVERGRLCELLWRGRFRAQARASLRQTLLGLKKQLAPMRPDFFDVSRTSVAINRSAVCSDLAVLELALASGQPSRASELLVAIGSKPLLDRLSFGEAFDQWLADRRAQIDQRLKHAAEAALADLQRGGDDPEHTRLLEAWQLRFPATSASDADTRLRIGILPFQSHHAKAGSDPIVQGLFDELVTTLGKVPQLLVAGRRSALNLAQSDTSLIELAEALRVAYLVQGSVQHHGEEVRVHVSLVDGRTGFETWSNSYGGANGSVFALQDDIARAVSRALGRALGLDIDVPGQRRTTSNKAAYELYLQGRALTARAIGDGVLDKAVELLEASLAIDPEFAACWTALAEAHVYTAVYTPCLNRLEKSARMAECAEKAIDLDPSQGHARAMLGIHHWTLNDAVGAIDLAHEAYRLEPDNPDVVLRLGSFLLYIGRTREALPYIEQAIDLNPVDGRSLGMLSVAQLNLGHVDAAITAGQRMVDLGLPAMWLAVATAAAGDHKLAVEQYRQTRLLMNTVIFPPAGTKPLAGPVQRVYWQVAAKGVCSGRTVHRKVYCSLLDHLHKSLPDPGDTSIVAPAIWMGYADMVFKTLGAQITPANMYCLMSLWADIEPIRQIRLHPDFLPFAERIGLVAAWDKYGWPDLLAAPD